MKGRLVLTLGLAIVVVASGLQLEGMRERAFPQEKPEGAALDMLLSFLGEFRYTVASYLWIKTEFYHHEIEAHHDWREEESIMPIIRFITKLDPHFVQAYDFGGFHLAVNLHRPKEGLEFLKEGLRNNPDNEALQFEIGFVNFHLRDFREAVKYLELAHGRAKDKTQNLNTTKLLAHSYIMLGNKEKAAIFCREWLSIVPDDPWPRYKLKEMER